MSEQWEYTVISPLFQSKAEDMLNVLGADGWEVAAAYMERIILKRPKRFRSKEERIR